MGFQWRDSHRPPAVPRLAVDCFLALVMLHWLAPKAQGRGDVDVVLREDGRAGDLPGCSDVVIYGSNVCGVTAAVAAARTNAHSKVALLINGSRLGGMTSGGLGGLDSRMVIGGLAAELYHSLGNNFEPHVAEAAMQKLLGTTPQVKVYWKSGWLANVLATSETPKRILSIVTTSGLTVCGKAFVDCSYEGDLLRLSGTDFAIGREASNEFNETLAGADGSAAAGHRHGIDEDSSLFDASVSPYVDTSNTTLLPGIVDIHGAEVDPGSADDWVMSYNFRLCMTDSATNSVPIVEPPGYTTHAMELLRRQVAAWTSRGVRLRFDTRNNAIGMFLVRRLPNRKIDLNSGWSSSVFSTDLPFLQHDWPLGNAAQRTNIFLAHKWWTQALLYFLMHDPAMVAQQPEFANEFARWGLCKDEFTDTGNWPPQLYVRESVRLRGQRVLMQHNVAGTDAASGVVGVSRWASSVGLSSWGVDIHPVRRVVVQTAAGARVANAGGRDTMRFGDANPPVTVALVEIPYEALTPRPDDTSNLVVPVCASFSHVAFSTYRLEPQYAIFGHSAGTAAALSARTGVAVQQVNVSLLQELLIAAGQLIRAKPELELSAVGLALAWPPPATAVVV